MSRNFPDNGTGDVDFFEEADTSTGSERFKAEITNLAREVRMIDSEISDLQEKIKGLARQKAEIESKKLPDLLHQAGVKEITTLEGLKVSTKFIVGAIPAESKERAYEWLDQNGHSGIIKRELKLQFDRGASEKAEAAAQQMREMGFDPVLKMDVHPQTFMAFAREQIQSGKMLPLDQWGVFYGDKAVIK